MYCGVANPVVGNRLQFTNVGKLIDISIEKSKLIDVDSIRQSMKIDACNGLGFERYRFY